MSAETIISVDAMGGDQGPGPLLAGLSRAARTAPELRFLLFGDEAVLKRQLKRRRILKDRVEVRHAPDVVAMDEKPSRALRSGRNSSLWHALQAVSDNEAKVALSAGNTGAIVAMATLALRRAPGVHRPAIAVHWPAKNENGYNVVLDMGADIKADAGSLVQYAGMGAAYSRLAFGVEEPRVGLLNVGSEDMKGRTELQEAKALLDTLAEKADLGFRFVGFVEGMDILSDRVDVVVTDGFTGNIAMKASEG
ncbi:MAG: phosphate acyltransferase, partial [Pseudomonadota bacterium]